MIPPKYWSPTRKLMLLGAMAGGKTVEATALGNPLTFITDVSKPLKSLLIPFSPRQEGSGDPSPENIRSIIPWNGLKVLNFAENLLNINSTGKTQAGMSYTTVESGGKRVAVRVSGETTDNNSFFNLNYVSAETLSISPGSYKVYGYTEKVGFRVYYVDANGIQRNALVTDVPEPVNTFTIPSDAKCSWMRLQAAPDVQIDELIYPVLIPENVPITDTDIVFPAMGKNLFKLDETEMISSGWNRLFPNPLKKAGTYTVSCTNIYGGEGNKGARLVLTDDPTGEIKIKTLTGWQFGRSAPATKTFTISEDDTKTKYLCFQCESRGCTFASIEEAKLQIEVGSTATAYEPFTNAVYGGTLDPVSGVLTVEWVLRSMKAMRWGNFASFRIFVAGESKDKVTMPLCDCYPVVRGNPSVDQTIGAYDNGAGYAGSILFCKDGMTSEQDFKDWLNSLEYDPYIAYRIENPQTIQLTGVQITALLGNNTIWSDADGSMTAVYLKKG